MTGPAIGNAQPVASSPGRGEAPMNADTGSLWALALLLQVAVGFSIAAVWSWRRWGLGSTWIIFVPVGLLLDVYLMSQVVRLLPNLM
jgi:sortase A